jgi:hypothetical protein
MKTIQIIGAWGAYPAYVPHRANLLPDLALFLGAWLAGTHPGLGFTVTPSFGGGAGWPVEPGFVVTFAGVPEAFDAGPIAEWIRARESQDAVVVLERTEAFRLVERPAKAA